jgi:hypothetical protein
VLDTDYKKNGKYLLSVLIIGDNGIQRGIADAIGFYKAMPVNIYESRTCEEARDTILKEGLDVILLNAHPMRQAVEYLRRVEPDVPIIALSCPDDTPDPGWMNDHDVVCVERSQSDVALSAIRAALNYNIIKTWDENGRYRKSYSY